MDFRSMFPFFSNQPDWVYLDNAATTHMPTEVLEGIDHFQRHNNSTIHRGLYDLSSDATISYEAVRDKVKEFLHAPDRECIALTGGTTESINIIANGYLLPLMTPEDNVVVTLMEHHANFIPWQQVCRRTGAEMRIVPINADGSLDLTVFKTLVDSKTRLIAVTHLSNTLGTFNPLEEIALFARFCGVPLLVDAAQSAAFHTPDLSRTPIDFLTFSGHKLFGPFGTGVLFADKKYHTSISPLLYGGGMIRDVKIKSTAFSDYPYNLEGGTTNVTGIIGMGLALDFIRSLSSGQIRNHIKTLSKKMLTGLQNLDQCTVYGHPKKSGIISFGINGIHPHDVAGFLASEKIAVRAGMHCAQPLMDHLGLPGTVRISLSLYNNLQDVNRTLDALSSLKEFWK